MSLPKGFIAVEYIESSGEQYIDTEFMPNQDTRVVCKGQFLNFSKNTAFFGSRYSTSARRYEFFANTTPNWYSTYNGAAGSYATASTDVIVVDKNKNETFVDNNVLSTHEYSVFQCDLTMYLFAYHNTSGYGGNGSIRIYSCQIYDNGTLVRDYIPAKLANGAVGLWNSLDGVFYTDAAGGSFIAGPEIQIGPEAPAELAYTVSGERISLSWSASEGADGYRVYMDGARVLETTETAAELPFPLFTAVTFGVSAYNTDGESAQTTAAVANFPKNPILYLVTDRTPADVERVKQLAAKDYASMTEAERNEWNAGLKGAYNASDLNRVQAAMAYLADRLNALGYYAEAPHQRAWTASDMPKPSDMAAYLSDVEKLRAVIPVMPTTPDAPPDAEKLTYSEANNIEKILVDIGILLNNMTAAWFYSGEIYSGEV